MKVAILGGGLAGLTTGYLLKQKGIQIEILEKEANPGGLLRSFTDKGFTFDIGGTHIIFSRDSEVLDFLLSLLIATYAISYSVMLLSESKYHIGISARDYELETYAETISFNLINFDLADSRVSRNRYLSWSRSILSQGSGYLLIKSNPGLNTCLGKDFSSIPIRTTILKGMLRIGMILQKVIFPARKFPWEIVRSSFCSTTQKIISKDIFLSNPVVSAPCLT